nr:hypothetical protein CFP56_48967 [Quercus suber]
MYNHLKSTLDLVEELSRVALENVRASATEASTQATGRGGGGRGSGRRGRSRGPGGGHGDEDDFDDEAFEGDWDMYMDGVGSSRCMSDAAAQPSHPAGHDYSADHTSCAEAGPQSPPPTRQSPPPTRLSPPLFSGSAHDGGCIFVPTPGRPTPPVVQAEPTQDPSLPNPDEPAAQIEQIQSENIEPIHGFRRSLRIDIHPPGCGTGDGKTRPTKAAVRKRKQR